MYNSNGWNNASTNIGWNPQPFGTYGRQLPHYELIRVNGEQGARTIQMAPNSTTIMADNTNPNLLWMAQTDGAGYLTVTPLDAFIHQDKSQPSVTDLEARVKHLEELYDRFNSGSSKQPKKQRQSDDATAVANAPSVVG